MRLYFTHTNMIYSMDMNGKNRMDIANATAASGLDFHYKRRLLFFTDTDKRKVYQLRLDETGTKPINKRDYRLEIVNISTLITLKYDATFATTL